MSHRAGELRPGEWAQAVLEVLKRPSATAAVSRRLGVSPEELCRAADCFVDAGARAVATHFRPARWSALSLALKRAPSKRTLEGIRRIARTALRTKRALKFGLMWKPPGLRLRFESEQPEALRAYVERALSDQGIGVVRATYEPEAHQFGGVRGVDIAHSFATADSLGALDLACWQAGGAEIDAAALSLRVLRRLLDAMADDEWERWDVIRNLRLAGRLMRDGVLDAAAVARLVDWATPHFSPQAKSPAAARQRRMVEAVSAAGADAALALRMAADEGALSFAPREIFPFWIIFHWNRWRLSGPTQVALSAAMERMLSPKVDRT